MRIVQGLGSVPQAITLEIDEALRLHLGM